jgi:hypothetical protein
MIAKLKVKPEPTECERIMAIADEIKRHQERMLELITAEAEIDKAAYPGLPLGMLVRDIQKYGVCPCDAMLHRLAQNYRAAELNEKQLAEKAANG